MTLRAASVRASVERGDALAVLLPVQRCYGSGGPSPSFVAALTDEPKADPPQPVAADPEVLDAEANRDYLDDVPSSHTVEFAASDGRPLRAGEAIEAESWSEEARLAFLARVQRIDPRVSRP